MSILSLQELTQFDLNRLLNIEDRNELEGQNIIESSPTICGTLYCELGDQLPPEEQAKLMIEDDNYAKLLLTDSNQLLFVLNRNFMNTAYLLENLPDGTFIIFHTIGILLLNRIDIQPDELKQNIHAAVMNSILKDRDLLNDILNTDVKRQENKISMILNNFLEESFYVEEDDFALDNRIGIDELQNLTLFHLPYAVNETLVEQLSKQYKDSKKANPDKNIILYDSFYMETDEDAHYLLGGDPSTNIQIYIDSQDRIILNIDHGMAEPTIFSLEQLPKKSHKLFSKIETHAQQFIKELALGNPDHTEGIYQRNSADLLFQIACHLLGERSDFYSLLEMNKRETVEYLTLSLIPSVYLDEHIN